MKICVISDIHGNCVALDAVLEDVQTHPVDAWVCLGDALQGGPQPAQVADRLRDLGCPVVLGNADAFVLHGRTEESVRDEMVEIRDWTTAELGPDGLEFISSFARTHEIELPGSRTLLCCHGSPRSFDEVLLPDTDRAVLEDALGSSGAAVVCGGHTHLQWTATLEGRTFFNPGSVGASFNRHLPEERFRFSTWAEFAVVHADDDGVRVEFCRVSFDEDAVVDATLASGHPYAERQLALFGLKRR